MRPSASASETVSTSRTGVTRAAMIATASSSDIIGPPKAKQSSDNCAILTSQLSVTLRARTSSIDSAAFCIIAAMAGMSSRWATGSVVLSSASVAMPTMPGSSGNSTGLPLAARCTSILRCGSDLKPSTITRSTRDIFISNSGSRGSDAPRNSCIRAHRLAEDTSTSVAPDCRCTQESLPGTSTSKLWWACLTTETRRPSLRKCGIMRVSSVVLPAPLHPASPITLMSFSGGTRLCFVLRCFISANRQCHASVRTMMKIDKAPVPLILPNPHDPRLTERVAGTDQTGAAVEINVPVERPLTLYLNAQEIVTMMTIGDYPEYLALGYLLNQNMLKYDDVVTEVEYDDDLQVVVVRTKHHTNFEQKLKKRTQTSGCAQGTAFGDLLEAVESVALPKAELRTSWLYQMTHAINTMPSLYLEAGAIHGCVLCKEGTPVCYTEDVGRHNAVDKIAGWMFRHGVDPADKILYTTGRLTSEMVIKTVRMGIPILVSRSGFTAWGVDLARQVGLTLVGRTRGKRFIALSGQERIVYDQNLAFVEEESARHKRKGEGRDD